MARSSSHRTRPCLHILLYYVVEKKGGGVCLRQTLHGIGHWTRPWRQAECSEGKGVIEAGRRVEKEQKERNGQNEQNGQNGQNGQKEQDKQMSKNDGGRRCQAGQASTAGGPHDAVAVTAALVVLPRWAICIFYYCDTTRRGGRRGQSRRRCRMRPLLTSARAFPLLPFFLLATAKPCISERDPAAERFIT